MTVCRACQTWPQRRHFRRFPIATFIIGRYYLPVGKHVKRKMPAHEIYLWRKPCGTGRDRAGVVLSESGGVHGTSQTERHRLIVFPVPIVPGVPPRMAAHGAEDLNPPKVNHLMRHAIFPAVATHHHPFGTAPPVMFWRRILHHRSISPSHAAARMIHSDAKDKLTPMSASTNETARLTSRSRRRISFSIA